MFARLAVIIVLGFLAYASMLTAPFRVMDDRISIVENPAIKSLQNLPQIFKEGYFHDQSYYRPLINLTFMVEYHFFGFDPFFYNLDNLFLHLLNALLVFMLVLRLTDSEAMGFWTGLLFAIHPVQWEAVCNIPGRSILLSAFFVLSSFVLFLEFYKNHRWFCLPLVLVTFFLSLLCKESAGVLTLVVTAYLAADRTRPWAQKWTCLGPFILATLAYLFLRVCLGMTNVHQSSQPMVYFLGFVTFLRSVFTDLRLFVLPVDLHYDRCLSFMLSLQQPQAWGTCLCWAAILSLIILNYRKIPVFILFLIVWFGIELLPVSQLVASVGVGAGRISTAEHFLYLASVPVLTGIVMAFRWFYELNLKEKFVSKILLKTFAAGFLSFLWLTAVEQSIYASNEFTMLKRSLSFEPHNPRLQGDMGMLSVFRGDIPDAEKHFRLAIDAEPLNPSYHISLGTALCQEGHWIEGLEQLVVLDPGKDKQIVERQEKLAMIHLQKQLRRGKNFDARGWLAIGIYYAKQGQALHAIDAFQKTVGLNPRQPDAWFNLGTFYEGLRQWPQAKTAYQTVLTLPGSSVFQKNFALQHLETMAGH